MQQDQQTPKVLGRAIVAATGLLVAGALYLIAVRGEALLADLAALGSKAWCF